MQIVLCHPLNKQQGGGLGGATIKRVDMKFDELEKIMGKYMTKKVRKAWTEKEQGPGVHVKKRDGSGWTAVRKYIRKRSTTPC